jgi:hypothetical protein
MTLKEKFSQFTKKESWEKENHNAEECEIIADDYAIEILEYYHNSLFFIKLKEGESKIILEHIKKVKNL